MVFRTELENIKNFLLPRPIRDSLRKSNERVVVWMKAVFSNQKSKIKMVF